MAAWYEARDTTVHSSPTTSVCGRSSSISSISSISTIESKTIVPFPFFDLPYELRTQVFEYILRVPGVIDIDFNAAGITSIFLVSKRFHEEAAESFFSSNKFRLLPTHSKAAARRAQPLVKSFPPRYRRHITKLELRLGPFWTNPPPCWKIVGLGCKDLAKVKRLDVFVEVDPSIPMYKGYRRSEMFYTDFCGKIMVDIFKRMPALDEVRFGGHTVISPTGSLVQRMVDATHNAGKMVSWGPGLNFDQNLSEELESLNLNLGTATLDGHNMHLLAPHA